MTTIEHNGARLAYLIRSGDHEPGLRFFSRDSDYVQVGTWGYARGQTLLPHVHNVVPRLADRTQEVVHLLRGRLRASLFDDDGRPVTQVELGAGDTLVLLAGGHGYEILEDDTRVLEIKNGPYAGAEADRRRIA